MIENENKDNNKQSFMVGVMTLFIAQIVVKLLGLEGNRVISIAVGSVFDWADVICYGIGCILLGIYEIVRIKMMKK